MAQASLIAISLPADPTDPLHAASKQYVDATAGGGLDQATADALYVNVAGDLMTGSLKISTPVAVNSLWLNGPGDVGIEWDGVTDPGALKFLVPTGGYIDCGGVVLSNAWTTAYAATDLTPKGYVDTAISTTWLQWSGTQAEYDAIVAKNPNTLYVVV